MVEEGNKMLEREIKAEIVSKPEIIVRKLSEMGFRLSAVKRQVDIYYTHPCFNFKERDEALRLRLENGEAFLTYKGPRRKRQVKTREEIEAKIYEPDKIQEILERLGFRALAEVRKERKVFTSSQDKKLKVMLDYVEDLGYFLEIEAKEERVIQALYSKLQKCGLRIVHKTYLEMIIENKRNQNIKG